MTFLALLYVLLAFLMLYAAWLCRQSLAAFTLLTLCWVYLLVQAASLVSPL